GTITGSHTYATAGTFTAHVTITDDDGGSTTATFTVTVAPHGVAKFMVVDQSAHALYRYDAVGNTVDWRLTDSRPRGDVASDDATILWNVDADHNVFVYNASDGTLLGSWATGLNQPQDIATDGTDIWIADD